MQKRTSIISALGICHLHKVDARHRTRRAMRAFEILRPGISMPYALNNPLKSVDPDEHEVVCNGIADDCKEAIAGATGNADAAARVGTKTTTTQHSFLGLFHWETSKTTITISGDVGSFRALGQNASRLADLVSDTRDFGFDASSSTYKGDPIGFLECANSPRWASHVRRRSNSDGESGLR